MSFTEQAPEPNPSPISYVYDVPSEPEERDIFLRTKGREVMVEYMFACTVDSNGLPKGPKARTLNPQEMEELNMILLAFSGIDDLTKETVKKINLKQVLKVVLNKIDTGNKRVTRFPQSAIDIAQNAWDRYMSRYDPNNEVKDWGVDPENALLGPEDTLVNSEDDGSKSPRPATRRRMPSTVTQSSSANAKFARPSPSHPIFGTNGMMRGILSGRSNEGRISYKFDPYFSRPNFNVFESNRCTVGDWWPQQIAVVRDGAHGHIMGGIAGAPNEGVWSIVISGGYKGLDEDRGDTILYSGSGKGSEDNTTDTPVVTRATRAMQTAHTLGNTIRVIRSSRSDWRHAPEIGFRYDGLYRISRVLTSTNNHGGAYIRFELNRLATEPPYNFSRPTSAERKLYERIQNHY
ncbi:hypothetical protein E2P81_ATG03128 [Venturia nashicola]|uniref:YDG domain-containing protein n=1 Tax=Venturia nashicola TaxID=86259 RepID=A0A4Z1P417_9PEZI|nr:hypothetical protein E6O75_ATG03199 [Venturia nashicola]TLD36239.1 hypothetical protein E2P81_ATG03128 [Venturia nashicola]